MFLCPDVEDPGSLAFRRESRDKTPDTSAHGQDKKLAASPSWLPRRASSDRPLAGPAWQPPRAAPDPASGRLASRGLAPAMAGALFRSGGVPVIRSQPGGLSRPQVDAAGAPKDKAIVSAHISSERRPLLASSSKRFILAKPWGNCCSSSRVLVWFRFPSLLAGACSPVLIWQVPVLDWLQVETAVCDLWSCLDSFSFLSDLVPGSRSGGR
jgi:hypothetical protein